MKTLQKGLLMGGVLLLVAGGAYGSRGVWRSWVEEARQPILPTATSYQASVTTTPSPPAPTSSSPGTPVRPTTTRPAGEAPIAPPEANPFVYVGTRPAERNLAVPFMLQAPKQNWDMPYQEACEEASLLMVNSFLQGQTADFSAEEADRQILALVAYEESQGDEPDITLRRLAEIAKTRYGFEPLIHTVTSIEEIKNAIAHGYPVIVPASGKALQNPNFRNGGPPYHMVVAKGYLADGRIITNDPGTRKGKDYLYNASLFFNAIHDWNDGNVPEGEKIVLVLMPKN